MNTTKKLLTIILLASFSFTFSSCNRGPVFEKYLKMKNSIWDRFDQKFFEFPVEGTGKSYDITFVIRNNVQFQYDDMPVYVILTTPSGEERMREVSVPVRKNGKMIGLQNLNSFESRTILWRNINIADKGKCKISIENMIPKIQTEGIDEIGILVTRSEE